MNLSPLPESQIRDFSRKTPRRKLTLRVDIDPSLPPVFLDQVLSQTLKGDYYPLEAVATTWWFIGGA